MANLTTSVFLHSCRLLFSPLTPVHSGVLWPLAASIWVGSSLPSFLCSSFACVCVVSSSLCYCCCYQPLWCFVNFLSTVYQLFINCLSTVYQLFINFYQLFINFLSTCLSTFLSTCYQLFINFLSTVLSTFYQLFINCLSTVSQLFINLEEMITFDFVRHCLHCCQVILCSCIYQLWQGQSLSILFPAVLVSPPTRFWARCSLVLQQ